MADALTAAVGWIKQRLDANAEGLLEFKTELPRGIENQVWKDSWDAYHHADGTMANHDAGIAAVEVQVSTYDALLDAADLYESTLGLMTEAAELRERATRLKETILKYFWTDEKGGYFVLGTDRDEHGLPRQMKLRTSNMGHVLHSKLLAGDEHLPMRDALVRQLTSPELSNVSGIRTLANDEVRFRPGAYHNGSVWLWDTYHISKGLRMHGYRTEADDLEERLLRVVEATRLFPEYVRGDDSDAPSVNERTVTLWDETYDRANQLEQPPQEVQAWTVAAILAIKKRHSHLPD